MTERRPMPTALLALGMIALGSIGVAACLLSSRISHREDERGPGWIVRDRDGRELLRRLREEGL